jgi:hypothetical protein
VAKFIQQRDMEIIIKHDKVLKRMSADIEGHTAYVEYDLHDGVLDILHTYVPKPLEGRGIASKLVRAAYDYARKQGLEPTGTCSYAVAWLEKHPEYGR